MSQTLKAVVFTVIILCMAFPVTAATGPYLGQTPPGTTPQVFAPGIVTVASRSGGRVAFSPDGTECFFTTMNTDWTNWRIYYAKVVNGVWTTPALASFSVSQEAGQPWFSQDGNKLYFTSYPNPQGRFYAVDRTPAGWSTPVALQSPVNSGSGEWSYSQTADGTAYFASQRSGGLGGMDLYRTYKDLSPTLSVINLGPVLNSPYNERSIAIPPDGSYLIFSSARAGRYEQNLYVSFANDSGGWTSPIDLNVYCPGINTPNADEHEPSLSPDGRYLFFDCEGGQSGVYWVANPVPRPDPNGPVYNLSTGQRFASIQTAINYAQSGEVVLLAPGTYKENITLPNIPLTIRSANAQDSAVVSLTTLAGTVTLAAGTAQRTIQGLTITGGTDGISCPGAKLQLSTCVITGHQDCGVEVSDESTLGLDHCIVAGNQGAGLRSLPKTTGRGWIRYSKVDLTQCTFVQNLGYGLEGDGITVANSILYSNGISVGDIEIKGNNIKVSYSDVQGGFAGDGNVDTDPMFVALGTWTDPNTYILGDCQLQSQAGHWNLRTCTWVLDDATSPCIDAGDPNAVFGLEPAPNGGRANLGAYGNTPEASRSPSPE